MVVYFSTNHSHTQMESKSVFTPYLLIGLRKYNFPSSFMAGGF
jgi:hypothetical protein